MTEIRVSGPLFTGRWRGLLDDFLREAQDEVARQALAEVHVQLDRNLRNPTPYYETQIIVERLAADMVVHDRGIIYGPWLEGTGSRNRTTRFKGYASFRKATQATERQVDRLLAAVARRFTGRMSG